MMMREHMCLNPYCIPNPNKGRKKEGFNIFKDCTSDRIYVPCGYCSECIATKQANYLQRLEMEEVNNYLFFVTLTYQDKYIPSVVTSQGKKINYVDWDDFNNMFKRIRKANPLSRPIRYFAVSEFGGKKHRPHIHFVAIVPKYKDDSPYLYLDFESVLYKLFLLEWRRNLGSTRKPKYVPLLLYRERWCNGELRKTYDCHYVEQRNNGVSNDVTYYVTKYLMKYDDYVTRLQQALKLNLPLEEYREIWNLVRPKVHCSRELGQPNDPYVYEYLRDCIDLSKKQCDYPSYFSKTNGKQMPLSRYYKSQDSVYLFNDAKVFYDKSHKDPNSPKDTIVDCTTDVYHRNLSISQYRKRLLQLSSKPDLLTIFDNV